MGAQASFTASLDTRQAVVGSTVELSFTLKNAAGKDFRPPFIGDAFKIASGPNVANSMSIVNGTVSRGTVWSYVVRPLKEGSFDIGAATVTADGKQMKTPPLTLEVVKSRAPAGPNSLKNTAPGKGGDDQPEVMVNASPAAGEAWLGQQVALDYNLLTRRDLSGIEVNHEPKYDGFFAQNLDRFDRSDRREIIGGKPYLSKTLKKMALFPQQTGPLTIEPMVLQAGVVEEGGGMFGGFFSQARPTVLTTEPVTIEVKPLPLPVPEGFCGAVGSYTVAATISQNSATTDDAVSIKITLTGDGDPRRVNPPVMAWPSNFEVSQTKLADESSFENGEGLVSTKTFEYVLLPKTVGDFELTTEVAVFDPAEGAFKKASAGQPLRLKITQGSKRPDTPAPPADDFSGKTDVGPTGGLGDFFGSGLFLAVLGLGAMAALGLVFLRKNRQRVDGKPSVQNVERPVERPFVEEKMAAARLSSERTAPIVPRARAAASASIQLQEAADLMEKGDAKTFYLTVGAAVEGFFSERYRLEPGQLSADFISKKLADSGTGEDTLEKFGRVWRACEMARFAGLADAGAMPGVLADARFLIEGR